jgi:ATP-dependent protease Clp ATPase subunit
MSDTSLQMKLLDSSTKNGYFNAFWVTDDGIRYNYLVDRLLTAKMNVLVVGPSGTGKTRLVRNYTKRFKNKLFMPKSFNMTGNC